ncbi:MAG TPA: DUF169 domain-containing protein [Methanobacteriaceae archaeon]|nr:DUF169 domain-containing protein [Methanobacteriaceae archaeon]
MIHQKLGEKLKKILKLNREPVAIKWSFKEPKKIPREDEKSRFCRKIEKAMHGEIFYSNLEDELCMGGARYSGLGDESNYPASLRSGNFLVAAGVYKNIPAVQRSWQNNLCIPNDIFQSVIFAPLVKAEFEPDVVLIVGNARQGMEILHANAYDTGSHALGADSGPICSSMAAIPYLTGKVTYGFADIGARRNTELYDDEIMVSIPASELERIVSNLRDMRAKTFFKEK